MRALSAATPLFRTLLALFFVLVLVAGKEAFATQRTFNTGSFIISADACWQPNNDPKTVTGQPAVCDTNKNDKSVFQLYGVLYSLLDTGDQPDKCINNDGSIPQQKALFGYCKQLKIYWIIDATKTSPQAADLTLSSTDAAVNTTGLITIYNSTTKTQSGSTTAPIPYKGGPFVIDVNDLTTTEFNAIKAKFPAVKFHKANIPFSGNVDKVLIGKPPKIAVLNEGSSDVLEDYIRAAGQFAWRGVVFQYISAREIIAGCLQDPIPSTCTALRSDITAPFQLIWAPHWEIENQWKNESSSPSATDQTAVVKEIRDFLERGNSGFFECASIGSLEGSTTKNNIGMSVTAGVGGYLISNLKTSPRTENNNGCFETGNCDPTNYLKFEKVPFWLTQCGGWDYKPTSGLISSNRPYYNSTTPANSYLYTTTTLTDNSTTTDDERFVGTQMTRFIHDDPTKLKKTSTSSAAYTAGTTASGTDGYYVYDYLLGGRINGSPTQGYLVYFPGHKYISCTNNTTYNYPPSRAIDLVFNASPPSTGKIKLELVHGSCTYNSTCPNVTFDMATGTGTKFTADSKVSLSAEYASFDSASNRLNGIFFTSLFDDTVATSFQITDLYVTFDGSSGAVKLTNIVDLSEAGKHFSLCAPNATSSFSPATPLRCSLSKPESVISVSFSEDISTKADKQVKIAVTNSSGTATSTCTLNVAGTVNNQVPCTGSTNSTAGNMTLDMSAAVFSLDSFTLDNIKLIRGTTCANTVLTDVVVTFPGSTVNVNQVYNETTEETICMPDPAKKSLGTGASGPVSVESCSGTAVVAASAGPSITTSLSFNSGYLSSGTNSTNIVVKLTYSCGASCTGTVTSTYTTSSTPNSGNKTTSADGYVTLDMSSATFTNSNQTLSGIKINSNNASKTIALTKVEVTFQGSKQLKKFRDTTNSSATIYDFNSTSTSPASTPSSWSGYTIQNTGTTTTSSTWDYTLYSGMCSYYISPYLSTCTIDWNSSNTCGIKYVLNTFLALKYQSTTSEYTKTQPIVKDNILYKASFDYPSYRGHLKMIKVPTDTVTSPITVWDAATAVPAAGTSSFPSAPLASNDTSSPRYIFTTLPGSTSIVKFDSSSSSALRSNLGATSDNEATVIINTVRGRKNASTSDVYSSESSCSSASADGTLDLTGCSEDTKRLWAIENSTPALKTKSKYVESTASSVTSAQISSGKDRRDRFLFAGADDGMMHAFYAGTYDSTTGTYPDNPSGRGTGKESWAYIPSSLLSNLKNQPFNPDPANESSFEPKVSVDGSPALGDFLICTAKSTLTSTCTKWEWKTRLVGTAAIRSENHGIIFSLDVTDPYNPTVLWENKYDVSTDTACLADKKNCNMGESKGVAIGTAQIGDQLKDYVFLTSNWIKKKKLVSGAYVVCDTDTTGCVYGVSAFALDLDTGKVMWEKSIPYSSDAGDIVAPPAMPALMDRDNNGSYDYVVFGDMQGRLWALRTTDGKNLTGDTPVYEVKVLDSNGNNTSTAAGYKEPIGAPVSVYRDYVVLATGGTDYASNGASDGQKYRIEVVKIGLSGATKVNNQSIVLEGYNTTDKLGSETVWAKPAITSDLKVYVGTIRSYSSKDTVSTLKSTGRVIVIDLKATPGTGSTPANVSYVGGTADQWHEGGFVGGFDFDRKHAYIVTLKPNKDAGGKNVDILQMGSQNDFSTSSNKTNPYKILWWRKM